MSTLRDLKLLGGVLFHNLVRGPLTFDHSISIRKQSVGKSIVSFLNRTIWMCVNSCETDLHEQQNAKCKLSQTEGRQDTKNNNNRMWGGVGRRRLQLSLWDDTMPAVRGQRLTIVLSSFHQVPVAVYYESLCPDSAKFITEQLYPALKSELRDLVEITFVPFGKSQVSD